MHLYIHNKSYKLRALFLPTGFFPLNKSGVSTTFFFSTWALVHHHYKSFFISKSTQHNQKEHHSLHFDKRLRRDAQEQAGGNDPWGSDGHLKSTLKNKDAKWMEPAGRLARGHLLISRKYLPVSRIFSQNPVYNDVRVKWPLNFNCVRHVNALECIMGSLEFHRCNWSSPLVILVELD